MGEDAQVDETDEGYGLSPALEEDSVIFDNEHDPWICSIDGSCAGSKAGRILEQNKLHSFSEMSDAETLRSVSSKESIVLQPAVVFDDSQPTRPSISKKASSREVTTSLQLPSDGLAKRQHSPGPNSSSSLRILREISPIQSAHANGNHRTAVRSTSALVYDPLRRGASKMSMSLESGFSPELKFQGDKLMDGLKAILKEKIVRDIRSRSPSFRSTPNTVVTALSRAGSASTVSTGRDPLTKEMIHLREALGGIQFENQMHTGGIFQFSKGDESIPDSFVMPEEMKSMGKRASVCRSVSGVEEPRLNSDGSGASLTENSLKYESGHSSTGPHRIVEGASGKLCEFEKQKANSQKLPVRHLIITHRVKHELGRHLGERISEAPVLASRPIFHPFRLRSSDSNKALLDVDLLDNHEKHDDTKIATFSGGSVRETIQASGSGDKSSHLTRCLRKRDSKRGRPVVAGRTLYSRGRVHFRNHAYLRSSPRTENTQEDSNDDESESCVRELRDVGTETENVESKRIVDSGLDSVILENTESPAVEQFRKSCHRKKLPFVGSGQLSSETFSVAGNQQQVMRVTSTRFQEWLPLVRSIIYDSCCKDYAQALQRDLARQKRSHYAQLRLLETEMGGCKSDYEKQDIREDIARLKQQWTSKHERVLQFLNQQITKGGVWSKVKQLKTIYAALTS